MLTLFFIGFYFKYISKDWFPLVFGTSFISTIGFIILVLIAPESPKWLLLNNRTEEAIHSFNVIGKFNNSKTLIPESAIFVESLAD